MGVMFLSIGCSQPTKIVTSKTNVLQQLPQKSQQMRFAKAELWNASVG